MEMLDKSRRMIREWETSMEEDSCCCGMEAGLYRNNTLIQLLHQKEIRLQRMAQFITVALLLLISVTLALLITLVLGGSPGSQPMVERITHSPGISVEQQQRKDDKNPSAMLTAPDGNNTEGEFLKWESKNGNAFCYGGFNYSSGNLVVPRDGIYRVFLQITYESKKDECRLKLINKVHYICDSYNIDVTLLTLVDTVSCSMEQWSKSLYTAGLFPLEANGRLRVTSSHSDLIVKKEQQVFFGAELLPQ